MSGHGSAQASSHEPKEKPKERIGHELKLFADLARNQARADEPAPGPPPAPAPRPRPPAPEPEPEPPPAPPAPQGPLGEPLRRQTWRKILTVDPDIEQMWSALNEEHLRLLGVPANFQQICTEALRMVIQLIRDEQLVQKTYHRCRDVGFTRTSDIHYQFRLLLRESLSRRPSANGQL